jgi:hypothetical protein
VTVDLARLLQGTLFTRDFLDEGIRGFPEYRELSDQNLKKLRDRLTKIFADFPTAKAQNEAQTEDDLIWPILKALGWTSFLRQQNLAVKGRDDVPDGVLFADDVAKGRANAEAFEWKRYGHGVAVVESKRWTRPLDRRSNRKGEETAPSTQMLRYLRRVDDVTSGALRWGILTNGARWRVYYSGAKSVSEEFCELDLYALLGLEGDSLSLFKLSAQETDHWLRVFALVFSNPSFLPSAAFTTSFHLRALQEGHFYEERVAQSLASLVFSEAFPTLAQAIAAEAPKADLQEVRQAALVLLYRLLFLLYAEDRDLLPVRDKRFDDYSLRQRVREDVGRRKDAGDTFSSSATKYWNAVGDLCGAIDKGDASIGLPPYNGGLFDEARTPLLGKVRLRDNVMAEVIDILSFDQSGASRRYINYRDLSVQQLGSIYERLLEFELTRSAKGAVEVRPNIFARKRSGSYYTPEELVAVIIDETLEPLIDERVEAFRARSAELANASGTEDKRIAQLKALDPAEALLGLRVCDPAMGSGHFLVSLVDTLTDQVINAIAEAEELVEWGEYQSPLINRIDAIRTTIVGNAESKGWAIDISQLDDRHIIRRMVLKRCVYGVDKNPMAVELAKVSLWLHTFTVGAPLSFLDHHLRCGDSLFGLTVSGAVERLKKRWGASLLISEPLKRAMGSAASMQTIERLTDAEIAEAHRSAQIWDGVVSMVEPLDEFMRLLHAIDWIDVKDPAQKTAVQSFLDGLYGDPFEIARGKIAVDPNKPRAGDFIPILDQARTLTTEERFMNWQTAFPGVWEQWEAKQASGGFDAVIGNPPWDRMKMQEVEWFAARRRDIASMQRADDRKKAISKLKTSKDGLYADYEIASARAEQSVRVARTGSSYPLLSGGDINIYSLFVERALSLVRPDGVVGLLTPSGIASDKTAAPFFKSIATSSRLKALFDCENRGYFFPDIHNSFKFCVLVFGGADRRFKSARCAFYLHRMQDLPERQFELSARDFARVNPNTGTAPIFRTKRDAQLVRRVYESCPVLVDHSGVETVAQWPVNYATMLHMTNDSEHFRTRIELEEREGAYSTGDGVWKSKKQSWRPLYVGRMIHQFDHRAASVTVNEANLHNAALSDGVTSEEKADPNFLPTPQYWVPETAIEMPPNLDWILCFRDIARATDVRTVIAAVAPRAGYGNTLALLVPSDLSRYRECAPLMVANLNSLVLDYVARSKVQTTHVNWYIAEQLPVIPLKVYKETKFGPKTADRLIRETVLELTYTANDLAGFAKDMGYVKKSGEVRPPFEWDDERRLKLRAKLDAIFFHLYGITKRDDVKYVYSTFPIVEQHELAAYEAYRSRDLCLAYMNALAAGNPDADVKG